MKDRLLVSLLGVVLASAPSRALAAQAVDTCPEHRPIRAWAFARLGGASSAPVAVATSGGGVLTSASVGAAASDGVLLGLVRLSDSFQFTNGPEIRDWALLAGMRSRGDRLFLAGAAGIAEITPLENSGNGGGGAIDGEQAALAYDLSVHSDYRVAGLSFSISGVVGGAKRSYVAASLAVEAGWFGR